MGACIGAVVLAGTMAAGCGTSPGNGPSALSFRTEDGFGIRADLSVPADAADGTPPLVLLAHDLEGSRRTWDPLVGRLVDRGYAALAVDLRGFGESTAEAASPAELDAAARTRLHLDLLGALDAAGRDGRPDTSRVIVVAAGLSVNPAVRVASERSSVRGLVLITGLIEETEETHLRERPELPLLLIAAESDQQGRHLMQQYAGRLTGPAQDYLELPAGDAERWRGTDGLDAESGLAEHIVWFIERTFGVPPDPRP